MVFHGYFSLFVRRIEQSDPALGLMGSSVRFSTETPSFYRDSILIPAGRQSETMSTAGCDVGGMFVFFMAFINHALENCPCAGESRMEAGACWCLQASRAGGQGKLVCNQASSALFRGLLRRTASEMVMRMVGSCNGQQYSPSFWAGLWKAAGMMVTPTPA